MKRCSPLALIALAACAGSPEPVTTCGGPVLERTIVVLETDYQTSALGRIAGGCLTEEPPDVVLGGDVNLLAAGGRAWAGINEEGTLRAVDGTTLALGPRLDAYAGTLGEGGSAHGIYGVDVDAAGDLWVSRDDAGSVAILKADGTPSATIDLSDLDPEDGVPDMNGILLADGKAFVAVGRLAYPATGETVVKPRGSGLLAVIDAAERTRLGTIDLKGRNPVHALIPTDASMEAIVVATAGLVDQKEKGEGIYRVPLQIGGTAELLVNEDDLGGSVSELVWASDHEAYAIVMGDVPGVNPTTVVAIDPAQKTVTPLRKADAFVHGGIVLTDEWVVVGDHTPGAAKVLFFHRGDGAAREIPASVLRPFALVALPP